MNAGKDQNTSGESEDRSFGASAGKCLAWRARRSLCASIQSLSILYLLVLRCIDEAVSIQPARPLFCIE
jgi:hypothetical protein